MNENTVETVIRVERWTSRGSRSGWRLWTTKRTLLLARKEVEKLIADGVPHGELRVLHVRTVTYRWSIRYPDPPPPQQDE